MINKEQIENYINYVDDIKAVEVAAKKFINDLYQPNKKYIERVEIQWISWDFICYKVFMIDESEPPYDCEIPTGLLLDKTKN